MVSSYLALKTFDVLQGVLKDTRFGERPGPAVRHAAQPIAASSIVKLRPNGARAAVSDVPCEIIDLAECRARKSSEKHDGSVSPLGDL
jgi:hypothetical protein